MDVDISYFIAFSQQNLRQIMSRIYLPKLWYVVSTFIGCSPRHQTAAYVLLSGRPIRQIGTDLATWLTRQHVVGS